MRLLLIPATSVNRLNRMRMIINAGGHNHTCQLIGWGLHTAPKCPGWSVARPRQYLFSCLLCFDQGAVFTVARIHYHTGSNSITVEIEAFVGRARWIVAWCNIVSALCCLQLNCRPVLTGLRIWARSVLQYIVTISYPKPLIAYQYLPRSKEYAATTSDAHIKLYHLFITQYKLNRNTQVAAVNISLVSHNSSRIDW